MLLFIDTKLYSRCYLKLSYFFWRLRACDQSDDHYWRVLYTRAGEGSLSARAWPDRLLIIAICYLVCWCSARKGERVESARRDDRSRSHSRGWNLHFAAVTASNTNSILREYSQPLSRTQLYRLKRYSQRKARHSVMKYVITGNRYIGNRFSIIVFIFAIRIQLSLGRDYALTIICYLTLFKYRIIKQL